jgi:hypothetical protein
MKCQCLCRKKTVRLGAPLVRKGGAILLGEGRPEMIRIGVLYREAHDLLGKTGHEKLQALCLIKSQPASKKRK